MSNFKDIQYSTVNTKAFYNDCISHAVYFNLDRMPDNSWRRLSSDQPLEWVLDNLDKMTSHSLIVRRHTLEDENEEWGNEQHLEVNFELRCDQSTYIFSAEMEFRYLDYFVEKYKLNTGTVHEV
ncbi:hypothetical protein FACS189440_20130 [Bacteroidia bacterium]|nr:hypothetical protein FACS189440_20130 [Bacteroidia bacterium]